MLKFFCAISIAGSLVCSSASAEGDAAAGDLRYHESCHACHGPAGKGAASYPKVSGNPIEYTRDKLISYRSGQKFGPNSALMIMMAKPLSDEEIENLAVYLKDAIYE